MIGRLLQSESAFDPLLRPYRIRADRIMVGMNLFLMLVCLAVAPLSGTFGAALLIGLPTLLLSVWLDRHHAGTLATRLFMSAGFMIFTGLLIHQSHGDIEAHFAAFGLIGVLLYYRDWRTIIVATVVIYLHHLILGYVQTLGLPVYVFDDQRFWFKFGVHVAYFLPFIGMMLYLSVWLRREGYENQHVITLAQHIVQGNLLENQLLGNETNMPLLSAVRMMKKRLLDLLRVMPVAAAVIRIDTHAVISTNEAWSRIIGPFDDEGQAFGDSPIWNRKETWDELLAQAHAVPGKLLNKIEASLQKPDGTPIPCEISLTLHEDLHPAVAILTVEDISLRRQAEQTLQRLAYRDILTDLPNRASFETGLKLAIERWNNEGNPFAVVMLDLDDFKPVNDTYGHAAGDEALRIIGARLMRINRNTDLAARLGGDEFAILLHDCPNVEASALVAQRFIDAISRPISLSTTGTTVQVGASAGVAHITAGEASAEAILKHADSALYAAKADGKTRVSMFVPMEIR